MSKEVIGTGSSPNDGTGDALRAGAQKINANFTELYDLLGWGYYTDAESAPATQTFNNTPSKLQIDGGGASTEENYLPLAIRGSASLWDTVNDKITPIAIGDSYDLRINLEVTAEAASPTEIRFQLDIGGGGSPTIVVASDYVPSGRSTPYVVSFAMPIFTLSTFLANGGQIFISTDTGSITVAGRGIYISKNSGVLNE